MGYSWVARVDCLFNSQGNVMKGKKNTHTMPDGSKMAGKKHPKKSGGSSAKKKPAADAYGTYK
jgi:hypothetical protein